MTDNQPALSVLGVTKAHATRAIARLRRWSILAFYREADCSINAWEIRGGPDATYKAMRDALDLTR